MKRFINLLFVNRYNGYNTRSQSNGRTTRESIEDKACRGKNDRIEEYSWNIQARSKRSKWIRRSFQSMLSLCSKSKQCTGSSRNFYSKERAQAKEGLRHLLYFFIYNPQIIFTLIYIDSMFIDELININILQLNNIFSNIQTFINS